MTCQCGTCDACQQVQIRNKLRREAILRNHYENASSQGHMFVIILFSDGVDTMHTQSELDHVLEQCSIRESDDDNLQCLVKIVGIGKVEKSQY